MNTSKDNFYQFVAQTSDFPIGLEIDRAESCFFYTKDGKKIIDFISGIAVSSLGHRHPKVVQAIKEQVDKHLHVMVYGEFIQKPQSDFAGLIASQLPESLKRVYFTNSGTESNEGALKLAKKFTERSKLIGFKNSYHGDSHGSLSVTGRDVYREPFLPLLPDVHFLTFNSYENLDLIDEKTAAVIMEPIQGEGGIVPADKTWLQEIRKRCTEVGALLIFDEIQSGFGRTGSMFVFQQYDVVPDILTMAKAMGGGMPIGGFASSNEIFEAFKNDPPLNHVTTFGGHPVSCAAGLANLQVLLDEDLIQRAKWIEEKVKSGLTGRGIVEVRGKGAMLGLELASRELTQQVVEAAMEKNILLGWTLHSNTLIRLAPPLTIPEEILDLVIETLKSLISEFA
ncbi:aspartate aminotransferase family protein [bacterium]|nr:MAG: aspartate aminotransferase family protein [bacterium]